MEEKTEDKAVTVAKRWLKDRAATSQQTLEGLAMDGITIVECRKGFLLCHFLVSSCLTDGDGNWEVGAMVTLLDTLGVVTMYSLIDSPKVTLDFSISVFSMAKAQEEVEIEAKVVGESGRLGSVVIEIRRRSNRELIALAKQWVATINNQKQDNATKL